MVLEILAFEIRLNFQMFLLRQKRSFLGCFLVIFGQTPLNADNFAWNFDQWWHTRWCNIYATAFIEIIRNGQNFAKKLIFLGNFERFFVYVLLHPMNYVPRFYQWKDLIKIHICRESFISIAYVVVKSKIFKVFQIETASWSGSFWGGSRGECGGVGVVPYSPKYWSILLKFWLEVESNKTSTVFEKSIKIFHFSSNATHPKFIVLVHFGA